jgi:hypothetical protein
VQSNMTKYNEDPWWIFEDAQDWAHFVMPRTKKWSKRKKMLKTPIMKYR